MKTLFVVMFALVLAGCESSRQQSSSRPKPAGAVAGPLASGQPEAADRQRIDDGQPASFAPADWKAGGGLAVTGSTNSAIKIKILENMLAWFVGDESTLPQPSLTPEQAGRIACQLANDQADSLYHHRPFSEDGHLAYFNKGHWIWTGSRGFGQDDIAARVELAPDGSTISVKVEVLDNQIEVLRTMRAF